MGISLMITLSPGEWLSDVGGWRCEALKIPGARIDAVYAENSQVDPACYKADETHALLRWGKDCSPPAHVTVALLLEKPLSSADVTVRWKKLAILMPIITTGIGILFGGIGYKSWKPPESSVMEKYEIQGRVNLGTGRQLLSYEKIKAYIRPPDLIVYPDGSFRGDMSVCIDKDKKLINAPKLLIDSGLKDYPAVVIHLLNEGEKVPFGLTDFDVEINNDTKKIRLRKQVEFTSVPSSQGYDSSTQQTPTSVGPTADKATR